ncbi:hypothetical protein HPHPA8_0641 [Helicobacter pylori Hp A-8]|nr:hypothetical protein HPHPA8_0641 [Helicobacter pylori Hp A-8]
MQRLFCGRHLPIDHILNDAFLASSMMVNFPPFSLIFF